MYACMCLCMYVRMHVCMHARIFVHANIYRLALKSQLEALLTRIALPRVRTLAVLSKLEGVRTFLEGNLRNQESVVFSPLSTL